MNKLYGYKGLRFDPPMTFSTNRDRSAFLMELNRELRERGAELFDDHQSRVADEFRKRQHGMGHEAE
jgi:hypothetical protein